MKRVIVGVCLACVVFATMAQLNLVNVATGVVGILPKANGGTGTAGTTIALGDGTATAPTYTFASSGSLGMWRSGSALGLSGGGVGIYPFGNATQGWLFNSSGVLTNVTTLAFSALPSSANGSMIYCSDCTVTTAATCPSTAASCICAGSGTGALAMRVNSQWICTLYQ